MRSLFIFLLFSLSLMAISQHKEINLLRTKAESNYIKNLANSLIKSNKVHGLTFILANQGKIVFSKAYGYADIVKKVPLNLNHRMFMNDASQLFAATAILQLIQENKITLEDNIFGPNSILAPIIIPKGATSIKQIKLKHLLEKTVTLEIPFTSSEKLLNIKSMVKRSYNIYKPGESTKNNKNCYYLLAYILEQMYGKPYPELVTEMTKDIFINKISIHDRKDFTDMAIYRNSDDLYRRVSSFDAESGVICSPPDMMNFILSADGFPAVKDILIPAAHRIYKTPNSKINRKGKAWSIDEDGFYILSENQVSHTYVRTTNEGVSWVLCINGPGTKKLSKDVKQLPEKVIRRIRNLP